MRKTIFIFILFYSGIVQGADFYYSDQNQAIEAALNDSDIKKYEIVGCWGIITTKNNNSFYYPSPFTKYTSVCITEYEAVGINTTFSGVNDSQLILIYAFTGILCAFCFVIPISLQVGR